MCFGLAPFHPLYLKVRQNRVRRRSRRKTGAGRRDTVAFPHRRPHCSEPHPPIDAPGGRHIPPVGNFGAGRALAASCPGRNAGGQRGGQVSRGSIGGDDGGAVGAVGVGAAAPCVGALPRARLIARPTAAPSALKNAYVSHRTFTRAVQAPPGSRSRCWTPRSQPNEVIVRIAAETRSTESPASRPSASIVIPRASDPA